MGIVFLQAGTLSPGAGVSPGAEHLVPELAGDTDLSLLVHPSAPAVHRAMPVPSRPPGPRVLAPESWQAMRGCGRPPRKEFSGTPQPLPGPSGLSCYPCL